MKKFYQKLKLTILDREKFNHFFVKMHLQNLFNFLREKYICLLVDA